MKSCSYLVKDYTHANNYDEYRKKTDNYRKTQGMRKIKRGNRPCLGCEKSFYSVDLKQNFLCILCKAKDHE